MTVASVMSMRSKLSNDWKTLLKESKYRTHRRSEGKIKNQFKPNFNATNYITPQKESPRQEKTPHTSAEEVTQPKEKSHSHSTADLLLQKRGWKLPLRYNATNHIAPQRETPLSHKRQRTFAKKETLLPEKMPRRSE